MMLIFLSHISQGGLCSTASICDKLTSVAARFTTLPAKVLSEKRENR